MDSRDEFIDRHVQQAMNHYGYRNREDLKRLVEDLARRLWEAQHQQQGANK